MQKYNFSHSNGTAEIAPALVGALRARISSLEELAECTGSGVDWLLHEVLPKGFCTILYGDGGSGKSLLALDLALSLANGESRWLDTETAARPVRTLYLDCELSAPVQVERFRKLRRGRMGNDVLYAEADDWRSRNGEIAWHALADDVRSLGCEFVVVDSLGWLRFGAIEENDVARNAIDVLQEFATATGAAVLVIHHARKDGRMAGGHYLYHGARSVVEVQRYQEEDGSTPIELRRVKGNFVGSGKGWTRCVVLREDGDALVVQHKVTAGHGLKGFIIELLQHGEFITTAEIAAAVERDYDDEISRRTVLRALSELHNEGKVTRDGTVGKGGLLWKSK